MRKVSILGSTGSIGRSTLDVARMHPGAVKVVGLSTRRRIEDLAAQVREFEPVIAAVGDEDLLGDFKKLIGRAKTEVVAGEAGLEEAASLGDADIVLNAVVGAAGIMPSLAAIRSGKDLAIANKECLVAAGEVITREAAAAGVSLIPVDSEHSAVFQCLRGEEPGAVARITLTASGGPLKDMTAGEIAEVTAEDALRHPTWSMGRKVTIDSATLLNKGFEVIEAHWLFNIPTDRIDVMVERKSVVERFPCLELAYQAAGLGGTAPAALSAADVVVVESFLAGEIKFGDIYTILKEVVGSHQLLHANNIDSVMRATAWARERAGSLVKKASRGN